MTVSGNQEGFSQRQIKGGEMAHTLYATLRYPSQKDFRWIVQSNQMKDCPVTVQDVDVAFKIWGMNMVASPVKTIRSKPNPVVRDSVKVPEELLELHNVQVPIELAPSKKEQMVPSEKEQMLLSIEELSLTCKKFSHQETGMDSDEVARDEAVEQDATDTREGYEATDGDDETNDGHGTREAASKYNWGDNKFGPNPDDGCETQKGNEPANEGGEDDARDAIVTDTAIEELDGEDDEEIPGVDLEHYDAPVSSSQDEWMWEAQKRTQWTKSKLRP